MSASEPAEPALELPAFHPDAKVSTVYDVTRVPPSVLKLNLNVPFNKPGPMVFSVDEQLRAGITERHRKIARIFYSNFCRATSTVASVDVKAKIPLGYFVASQFAMVLAILELRVQEAARLPMPFPLPVDNTWAKLLQTFLQDYVDIDNPAPPANPHNVRVLAMRYMEDLWHEVIVPAMLERYRF